MYLKVARPRPSWAQSSPLRSIAKRNEANGEGAPYDGRGLATCHKKKLENFVKYQNFTTFAVELTH